MERDELDGLLLRYREGNCTEDEKALLENWVSKMTFPEYQIPEKEVLEDLAEIKDQLPVAGKVRPMWPMMMFKAAIVLIVLGCGAFFLLQKGDKGKIRDYANELGNSKQGGVVEFSDGSRVELDSAMNVDLARKAGVYMTKNTAGEVFYHLTGSRAQSTQTVAITTALGKICRLWLPDKTLVYLNAGSSVKYHFNPGNDVHRQVELIGEAYFEVAKDKNHPFVVKTRAQSVEVLGTHFNINAYENEPFIKTALLEGSVKITGSNGTEMLKPGEEAVNTGDTLQIKNIDTAKAVGWKNGYLSFRGDDLKAVMRKIARAYDVNVTYDSSYVYSPKKIFAMSSAKMKLSDLLTILMYFFRKDEVPWTFTISDKGILVSKDPDPGKIDSLFKKRGKANFH